ncbi:MAG: penicillin-binding transpeptidase domain-containing protein [Verrucomicrobiales bacterium]
MEIFASGLRANGLIGAAASALACFAIGNASAQDVDGGARDGTARPVPQEETVEEAAAAEREAAAIPRYEDAPTGFNVPGLEESAMTDEEVDAVEIPEGLAGDAPAVDLTEEEMEVEADLQEEVDREERLTSKVTGMDDGTIPIASDLRAKSSLDKSGELGSSLLTRTEARTFTFSVPPPRGQLLDRNGYPLAQSKVAHYAAIVFPFLGDNVTDEEVLQYAYARVVHVNNILGADWSPSYKDVIKHYKNRRWFPFPFSDVLSEDEAGELERQKMEGLTLHPIYLRHYPQGKSLSHVIGYVGKRPPRSTGVIVNDEPLWGAGYGVDGLEETFDADLRGTPGRVNVLFEADGTKVKEDILTRPRPGHNVITAIDLEMQRICESLLAEKVNRGAMVVMDVRNGDVMAMASYPQFDPNDFIPSISQEKYSALAEDPAKPLFPRAYRAVYPPASTFKIAAALGFLESGYISASDVFNCPSSWRVGDVTMRNWNKEGEGMMNVVGALTRSCNTWFYEVSTKAGADSMSYMATRLGLGRKTGIPLNESAGFVPSNRWWLDKHGYMMSDGEEAVMSIGQGTVAVTSLQVARMMAAIGNGKQVPNPRLVLQIQDSNHELERTFPIEVANSLNVDPYSLRAVRRGLYDVVNAGNGTGTRASHKITVSGKTGTGQWKPQHKQNIAWFAGYFPAKHPVYSFAVICEGEPGEVVSGGKTAAPVVGEFLEQYLTEENYNEVREMANVLKEEQGDQEEEGYSYREPVRSIFRSGPEAPEIEEVTPQEQRPQSRERSSEGGGFFERIFKRKRR